MKNLLLPFLIALTLLSPATAQEVDWYGEYNAVRDMKSCPATGFNRFVVTVQTGDTEVITRWRKILPPGASLTLCWSSNDRPMVVVGPFGSRVMAGRHAARVQGEILYPYYSSQMNSISVMQGTP